MDLHEVIRLAEQTAMGDHRKPYAVKRALNCVVNLYCQRIQSKRAD